MKLLIAGAGGHGRVVADAAADTGAWQDIAFLDDRYPEIAQVSDWRVAGTLGDLERIAPGFQAFIAAFGDSVLRLQCLERARSAGLKIATIVHPRAAVSSRARLGAGTVVFAAAAVNAGALLGSGCIVNTGATIDHDCELGDGVHICPGVNVAGNVRIGDSSWIGIGSCVIQGICIGQRATIGAGAVIIRDVADGLTMVGNPARELRDA